MNLDREAGFSDRDVEVLEDRLAYDGFFKIRQLTLRHRLFAGGWGVPLSRELFQRHEAVGVLLYDPVRDEVALVEQFRVGTLHRGGRTNAWGEPFAGPWLLELVAGLIDAEEAPAEVGRREALEEAGCEISTLEPICSYFSSPGGSDEFFYLYCGRCDLSGAGGIHGLAEEGEDIRVHVLPVERAFTLLADNRIGNAHTLIALLWLQSNRERLREQWR
ncbi:MAG: NUDIX domain-containing protein [Spongiibacteraceae bacterium]|jgi:ADP-ribose pyrophosphatase|nr:NUDIX domain-containing protein [Spongiibacteraceae bacterium]